MFFYPKVLNGDLYKRLSEFINVDYAVAENIDEVNAALSQNVFDAVVVPDICARRWIFCEPHLDKEVTVPRLVSVLGSRGWTPQQVHDLGFDGFVMWDQEESFSEYLDQIKMVTRSTSTRGMRAPTDLSPLNSIMDTMEELSLDDNLNAVILELVALGLSDRMIAARLSYAEQTIKNRISKMLAHSGVPNRTRLVFEVMRMRLSVDDATSD